MLLTRSRSLPEREKEQEQEQEKDEEEEEKEEQEDKEKTNRGRREGRRAVTCYVTRCDATWYDTVVFAHQPTAPFICTP